MSDPAPTERNGRECVPAPKRDWDASVAQGNALRCDNEPEHSRSREEQSSRSSLLLLTVSCWLLFNLRDRWQAQALRARLMLKLIGNLESRINQLKQELKQLKQN